MGCERFPKRLSNAFRTGTHLHKCCINVAFEYGSERVQTDPKGSEPRHHLSLFGQSQITHLAFRTDPNGSERIFLGRLLNSAGTMSITSYLGLAGI